MRNWLKLPSYAAMAMMMAACQQDPAFDVPESFDSQDTQAAAITGENLGGTNLGGANLGGANLGGVNLGGANLGGTNLSGTNLGGANLGGTNLGGPNLAGNNLSGTNLSGANLAGTNLSGTNLSGTNLAGSNLSGTNLSGPNLSGTNLSGTNLSGANLSAADIGKSIHVINDTATTITSTGSWVKGGAATFSIQGNIAYANATGALTIPFNGNSATVVASKTTSSGIMRVKLDGAQVALVDLYGSSAARQDVYSTPATMTNGAHTITLEWTGTKNAASTGTTVWFDALRFSRPNQMLRSGEDIFHVDNKNRSVDNSCVVMGLGSTAFTRLVTANTGANMYGVLAKLPWGFKADAQGPMTLEAWEILVWGSNTYCTFIVPAPVGTTYEGVRGFVKAVFRWNAPPSKSITLGAIGGGVATVSYTGMMNAAAKFADGTLSDTNLIAGELSFTTATTNNVSVNVDFASYVQLKDGSYYVLGNPSVASGTTQYDEGNYLTVLMPDGSAKPIMQYITDYGPYKAADTNIGGHSPLNDALNAYLNNTGPLPNPKRCLGWKYINLKTGAPIPSGKCDTGVLVDAEDWPVMESILWKNVAGATTNFLTDVTATPPLWLNYRYKGTLTNWEYRPILGGTHVYLNEAPF